MSELSTQIKRLSESFPGSMAELARQTRIDRSTLYKILGGQRTPTEQQLQNLLSVLHVGPGEYASLIQLYARGQQGGVAAHRREMLHKLLTSAYRARKTIRESEYLPVRADEPVSDIPDFLRGEQLRQFVVQRLRQYLYGADDRPLMLSPHLGEPMCRALTVAFSARVDTPKPVWQLCQFVQDGAENSFDYNVETLCNATPLLLLSGIRYEGRMCYSPTTASLPGLPMPVYLLFPDLCLFLDETMQNAVSIRDEDAVAFVRLQYSRQYLRAPHPLFLKADRHGAEEAMARTQALTSASNTAFWLRDQPPLVGCLSPDLMRSALLRDAPSAAAGVEALFARQHDIAALAPHAYFSENGVLRFLRTGCIDDIPPDLYQPLPVEIRLALLRALRDQCAAESPRILRLLNVKKMPIEPDITIDVYPDRGVLLGQIIKGENQYRHCFLQEPTVTKALYEYLEELRTSELVCSRTYTVEFLEYCLQGGYS